ncbi:MAG: GDP-mannose 4,6-dehydratase [bacterium]|nr:GDP-mannose 4,6-dehydratase [bacterium]
MNGLKGKRVLVTGGSGFIGSHLTRRLVREGAEVGILTKYNSVIDNVRVVDIWDQISVLEADIRNVDSLTQIADFRPEVIYHLAAYNHVGDSFLHVSEAIDSNVKGTANVIEAYDDYERFVYISSSEVYGHQEEVPFEESMCPRPISPYAVGKYGGELYCRMKTERSSRRIVFIRPFNAYGPYQSPRAVIAEMILTCLAGRPVRATEGKQTRDFNFVENLVDGFMLAGQREEAIGETINLGSDTEISIRDLILEIHRQTGEKSELQIGALEYRPTEIWRMVASNKRAKELLGWAPQVDFKEGMRRTIAWYRAFLEQYADTSSPLCQLSTFSGTEGTHGG